MKEKKEITEAELLRKNFALYMQTRYNEVHGDKKFKWSRARSTPLYSCPSCLKDKETMQFMNDGESLFCHSCAFEGSLIKVARLLEPDKRNMELREFANYLKDSHGINLRGIDIPFFLNMYEKFGWDLVPCVKNDKVPFEQRWPEKTHKDKAEWVSFLKSGYNIGVKTGKISNIIVLDFDSSVIPDIFKNVNTITQKTTKGYHYFFQYEAEFPKTRIKEFQLDIETDGGQVIIYPSKVAGNSRVFNFSKEEEAQIAKMPEEIKEFLRKHLAGSPKQTVDFSKDLASGEIKLGSLIKDGSRNVEFIKLGGIFRKNLSISQTQFVLEVINNQLVDVPLNKKEMFNIVKTLDKYTSTDENQLAYKILEYLKYAEEGSSQDICIALQEKKDKIDKALSFLIKEQYVVKRGRYYHMIKKIIWRSDFPHLSNEVDFKVPYFHDIAVHNWGDMMILGGMPGTGKTTVSMNILKRLVDQNIKPYYICLETGSRFIKTACSLGLKETDFYWSIQTDPTKIEIEPKSVTILDWLMIKDKAQTDTVMQYFSELLVKTNGYLIILMQLKKGTEAQWFAPNMVDQFPAFAARYVYESETREFGSWHIDKIRESPNGTYVQTIPCKYVWQDKTLMRLDELDKKINLNGGTEEVII